ncbi:hypothetical protein D1007_45584 [Hordeum vulgare]|nr:hypothetical protein D1007_45584 [Hordeum vulgare]
MRTNPHALALDAAAAAKTCKPLNFTGDEDEGSGGEHTMDLGPTLSVARHTPGVETIHSLQVGAVTGQAANQSTIPVSQRATPRLVHGLDILRPSENMTTKAAEALIRHFDEPLSDADMKAIARLTKMDVEALKIAACMTGLDGAAMEARVSHDSVNTSPKGTIDRLDHSRSTYV